MNQVTKSSEIGLGQGTVICNMPAKQRLEFIAEGLPVIFDSASSLIRASQSLQDFPREAEILRGHASEECAKILILVDIVRCPPKTIASRIGPMIRWFYDHLARLIYAEAQGWTAMTVNQLQEYIDLSRQSHYLDGEYSEFIMPNSTLFQRESSLYADVVRNEGADPEWSSPCWERLRLTGFLPAAFHVVDALSAFGVLTLKGLQILAEVWTGYDVRDDVEWSLTRDLYTELANKLDAAGLITERANSDHARALSSTWQLPMYNIDFAKVPVPLADLRELREASIPYEY